MSEIKTIVWKKGKTLTEQEEHQSLVEYVEKEKYLAEYRAKSKRAKDSASLLTEAKWTPLEMDLESEG